MDNIVIQTSQNVAIEQSVASVGERIVASIIDYAFIFIYVMAVTMTGISDNAPLIYAILVMPVVVFYHLVSELAMNGQSWGKKIMKIKVVKIDGTHPDFVSYMLRWVFRIVDIWVLFGAISTVTIIMNGKGQRFGDLAAHTTVIRIKEKSMNDTIYTHLPENYQLIYPRVNMLASSDIYTAKEILQYIEETYCSADSMEMAAKAKKAIETKMGIQSEQKPEPFLKTIVLDYNFIYSK